MPRYSEKKRVPYQVSQMFDLVADVGKYPQFLPWCVGARIRSQTETEMVADLTIGFGPFRESFTSRVKLGRPDTIIVHYENGPFKYLNNRWIFKPDPDGCTIDFFVDFEFRSKVLQMAIGTVFAEAVRRMVHAFLKRARDVYGAPTASLATHPAVAKG
jgi:coenzyme Q-binding protein COQ10